MSFGETKWPTGRKAHRCEYCWGPIPKGEKHPHFSGMWEDEFQDWRMHEECYQDYMKEPECGFSPGEAEKPERIKQLLALNSRDTETGT